MERTFKENEPERISARKNNYKCIWRQTKEEMGIVTDEKPKTTWIERLIKDLYCQTWIIK